MSFLPMVLQEPPVLTSLRLAKMMFLIIWVLSPFPTNRVRALVTVKLWNFSAFDDCLDYDYDAGTLPLIREFVSLNHKESKQVAGSYRTNADVEVSLSSYC
jgi:hypothetical protein